MEVSTHFIPEHNVFHDPALRVLDQAATRAEQAAQRLQASTAIPFSQVDFEAKHPEKSFSGHLSSSASISKPTSTIEVTAASKPSVSSANSTPDVPRKRGRPRKARGIGQDHLERRNDGEERASSDAEVKPEVHGRYLSPTTRKQQSRSEKAPRYRTGAIRSSRARHIAYGLSCPSSSSEATNPEVLVQAHSPERSRVKALVYESHHEVSAGHLSMNRAVGHSMRPVFQEVVAPVIQSLTNHYEELYPGLDEPAVREEVCLPQDMPLQFWKDL